MKKFVWLITLSIMLAGCASAPLQKDQRAKIRDVGVISLVGEEFRFTKIGFTVFNNDEFTKNNASWQLDRQIEQNVIETLKNANPPIQTVAPVVDHKSLYKLYRKEGFGSYVSLDRIESDLKELLNKQPMDALILVHNAQVQDPILGTSIYLYGPGLYYRTLPFVDPFVKPHAFLHVIILDGKTLQPLSQRYIQGVSKDYGKMQLSWDDELKNNLSEKQWAKFQADIEQLVRDNVKSSLLEMGLQ